jgi:hypothetical protein
MADPEILVTDREASSAPESGITVRLRVFPLAIFFLLFKPRLCIDGGAPATLPWGRNFVPLSPGRHTLRCYLPYITFRYMGDSSTEVEVSGGTAQSVQWRTPWLVLLKGHWKVTTP